MIQDTILIVDDDEPTSRSLEQSIGKSGYQIRLAPDGFVAIRIVQTELVHLVILDVNLPVRRGIVTLREIKQIKPQLPVIMMTANPSKEVMVEALEEGAYSFLQKPLDIFYLRKIIQELLGV